MDLLLRRKELQFEISTEEVREVLNVESLTHLIT